MSKIFFISDNHFGHENAIRFDERGFKSVEEMDSEMLKRWNEVVSNDDIVYILGDLSWKGAQETEELLDKLNGKKHLILGNHDGKYMKNPRFREKFESISNYREIFIDKETLLVLCHYPIPCFKNHLRGSYHFYGHVHNSFEYEIMEDLKLAMEDEQKKELRMYNVGCMLPHMDFTPRTFEEIIRDYNYER